MTRFRVLSWLAGICFLLAVASPALASSSTPTRTPIKHFITIMQESHTFDNYFGTFPGADGIPPGTCMPVDPHKKGSACVKPFHITSGHQLTGLDHSTGTISQQYNRGRMNGFIYGLRQRNQSGTITMGYYDGRDLPYYWYLARNYVLFQRFFSSSRISSLMNHMYWVSAAPGPAQSRVPRQGYGNLQTIFDRLEASGVSWKFYIQNYDPQVTYRTMEVAGNKSSQVVWAPVLGFDRFIDDPNLSKHIVGISQYYKDLQSGTLPAVSYIVPSGSSEHPPASIQSGQNFVKSLIQALMRSSAWSSSAFMLTYDYSGGWYDHVPPPRVDKYGDGFRVPALLVSPYARKGHIDSTTLDFSSILKFIEYNWNLEPLTRRDATANNLLTAFDFHQAPRTPVYMPSTMLATQPKKEPRRAIIYAGYGSALGLAGLILAWPVIGTYRLRRRLANLQDRPREEGI